jgi:UDPglucose 6-dehydrogenase
VPELELADDPYEAATDTSCVVVCTAWEELRELDLTKLGQLMVSRNVVDARNLLDGAAAVAAGFTYQGMGRSAGPPGERADGGISGSVRPGRS